VMLSIVG